jgi:glutamate-1-semialdehyde 2,1-aminomutase
MLSSAETSPDDSPAPSFRESRALRARAHALIPGGSHTYAKGDDQFPEDAPGFITRGRGCHVWDVDGNEFIEYGMGLRAVTLGHAYQPIVDAATQQMQLGSNYSRPAAIEVGCADQLLSLLPGAEMVKFAKDGSSVTTAAITLARAYTGRNKVALCVDHPFYSYNDWFIGTTPMAAGIPQTVSEHTVTFRYNDLASVRALFAAYPGEIACVILEPSRGDEPVNGFLHELKRLCHEHGALFILDEMITGFRGHLGGGQGCYNIVPDLATFGKGLANGFALSALVGKREFMERGGLTHNHERVFLLSTTHGAETHALAAAMATMDVYEREPVIATLHAQGARLRTGIGEAIVANGLLGRVMVAGRDCNLYYRTCDQAGKDSQAFRTLFLQETIKRGLIMPSLVVSYSHTDEDIARTIAAVDGALRVYRRALDEGIEHYLVGRPVQPVYRKYN